MLTVRRTILLLRVRPVLVLLAGAWLFAALAPCVMAATHCQHDDPTCIQNDDCGAAALDCQLPDPNPPSMALGDLPPPVLIALVTRAPVALTAPRSPVRNSDLRPHTTPLNLHTRLLV